MGIFMSPREKILIVDDQPENIDIMVEALQSTYDLMAATSGEAALERARGESPPDLVLLDVMMPGMDGYEVCRRLKEGRATRDIPVIFVTALNDADKEAKGFDLGAVDYITKPISPPVVMARVRAHLQLIHARRVLMRQNDVLEQRVKERTAEVVRAQIERVEGLNNFANAMAHQIRNPVMALGGMSGLLLKKVPSNSPLSEYAVAVRENSLRLEHLVGVISDYVSLTVGKAECCSVRTIVEDAVKRVRTIAVDLEKDLDCTIELADSEVLVDAELAVLALTEIMQNAIEFSERSTVVLSILGGPDVFPHEMTATKRFYAADKRYGLRITDNGPGIPDENLAFATDPFFTTKASGVGLGLTRANRILHDELGGELFVESLPNEGVSVTVVFVSGTESD
nr:hybrid sensor histidine kinase/response regulator [uncultured Pseudodesulfovibrio sp.]